MKPTSNRGLHNAKRQCSLGELEPPKIRLMYESTMKISIIFVIKIIVEFDDSLSILRSKKLQYSVIVEDMVS
jgi:hypothetical protein